MEVWVCHFECGVGRAGLVLLLKIERGRQMVSAMVFVDVTVRRGYTGVLKADLIIDLYFDSYLQWLIF